MEITLQLDSQLKITLEELFHVSAQLSIQLPSLGLQAGTMNEDSVAIFRLAKELAFNQSVSGERRVAAEDLVRTLRFIAWLLGYGGETLLSGANGSSSDECAKAYRHFFASMVFQAQAQFSGFEVLLRSYGVDRQLDPKLARAGGARHRRQAEASVNVGRVDRKQKIQIRVGPQGTELSSDTSESTWTASAWKRK